MLKELPNEQLNVISLCFVQDFKYKKLEIDKKLDEIVNSLGSTEIYPFTGQSEIITDITSSGATLKANNLRILKDGNILKSSACILVSKKSLRDKVKKKVITGLLKKLIFV